MLPIRTGNFLLPKNVDMKKWAVIACDQHSANSQYWDTLTEYVAESPSTLNFIYPEAFLQENSEKQKKRINTIHNNMNEALNSDLFTSLTGAIFLERSTSNGKVRHSLLVEMDLEAYSFTDTENATILPSEATVTERIPPRLAVRNNSSLEVSHVQLLFNDVQNTVFEPLTVAKPNLNKIYDFSLNSGGGAVKAWHIPANSELWQNVKNDLENLQQKQNLHYNFLVGDGNHSLACAKTYWEKLKLTGIDPNHPARYVAVELLNLHDSGIEFEPIHRLLINTPASSFIKFVTEYQKHNPVSGTATTMQVVNQNKHTDIQIYAGNDLAINRLQEILDAFLAKYHADNPEALEYIHDELELIRLSNSTNTGLLVKGVERDELFPYVEEKGATARKTFSLGAAADKRYYIEARNIKI